MDYQVDIKWIEDGETCLGYTIRESQYANDPDDDDIFFYGLSYQDALQHWKTQEPICGEWVIIDIEEDEEEGEWAVDVPRFGYPGQFYSIDIFKTEAEAIEFAKQYGADDKGMISLISKIG
jgi:hypothetical protein